jgi:hypothetical protein
MHGLNPTVYCLPVHLPGTHMVVFEPDNDPEELLEHGEIERTALTEWFQANAKPPGDPLEELARQCTYQQMPEMCTYYPTEKVWKVCGLC